MAPGTRARDSDRAATCEILDSALAEGQLSMAEHGERVKAATAATTLGQLQGLVTDLQIASVPVQLRASRPRLPTMPGGRGLRVAVAAVGVAMLIGVAIGWGLYGNTPSPLNFTSDPGAKSDGIPSRVLTPPRQLQSLGGLNGLFAQMRDKFGDTRGFKINIYGDYASLERPDPAEPRRVLNYYYRGGWDDPSDTSVGADARVVDLAAFDVPTMVGIIRGAPETLGINSAEVKTLYVAIEANSDRTAAPESIQLSIYVVPAFGSSGYIELNGDATIKRVSYPQS